MLGLQYVNFGKTPYIHTKKCFPEPKLCSHARNSAFHLKDVQAIVNGKWLQILYSALTIYPCQIRVHQRWQSYTPTFYNSEEGVVAGHSGQFTLGGYLSTVKHTALAGNPQPSVASDW